METEAKTIEDFKEILKRRKWSIILPALICFALAVAAVFILPPIFRSTGTILIEEQEIPREYVMSTVTSYADQRIQSISQRIMSSTRLLEIINRYNLYANLRQRWTIEEVIEKMRKDIKFQMISADVVDRRTGRPTAAAIAFSISYDGKNPGVVQQVANVLASLYLEENLKVREQQTKGAVKFIEDEMKDVQVKLARLDAKISAYKQENLNTLPELVQLNFQQLDRIERDIEQLDIQLRTSKEKEGALQSQLAGTEPDLANPDKERLKKLRADLVYLKNRFSDLHPDVIKTRAEIAALEKKLKIPTAQAIGDKPDNPAYITLASQLASTQSEIDSLKKQIAAFQEKREEYRRRIENSPRAEEGYRTLMVERNNLQSKYDDLMKKHMETKVASGLEKEQMGERFTLIDPPRMPEKPVSPNRLAILLIGFVLGIGSGVGAASLKEYTDQSVRSAEALTRATGFAVLASIPEMLTSHDVARIRKRRVAIAASIALLILVGVLLFHYEIMDLDVFWARLMRFLGRLAI
ncbi:MAG TPA: XrtA system polysaccharide chain length determinant [Thermodesulfobacteriota bacterium]|nr:XrtA system polysaccharide chain length determinant [Thermodesulfobacteriota bacterium]